MDHVVDAPFHPTAPDRSAADGDASEAGAEAASNPHAPERLAGYRTVAGVYLVGASLATAAIVGRGGPTASRTTTQEWSDIALVGLASFKLSRLLTKQTVTSPLRAPFTEYAGPGGPGEVNVRAVATGWRRSVGELLSCPFCLDVWIATASIAALRMAPRPSRLALSTFAAVGVADLLQFVYVSLEHGAEG